MVTKTQNLLRQRVQSSTHNPKKNGNFVLGTFPKYEQGTGHSSQPGVALILADILTLIKY